MLLSKANLQAVAVSLRDRSDPVLHQLHVEPDGSTVASDDHVLMAVSPVKDRPAAFPNFDGEEGAEGKIAEEKGIGIMPDVANRALKDMPRGALGLELGFAAVTKVSLGRQGGVELTTTDLSKHLKVEGRKAKRNFPPWKEHLAEARKGGACRRVCVDRRALVKLLQAIDAAGPDPEHSVFIEIPDGDAPGLVLRARNVSTGQSIVGLAMSTNTDGQWLELSEWEKGIFEAPQNGSPRKKPKRKPKRRRLP